VDTAAHDQQSLTHWLAQQLPAADEVRIQGLERVEVGHSAEMLALTLMVRTGTAERTDEIVLRLRPPSPGLIEPYDMDRQFRILRALEPTAVLAPRALWLEPTGDVLGREFYVMERLPGVVYERVVPPELDADAGMIPRMCEEIIDQMAVIHQVDLQATGLDGLGEPTTYLDREVGRWSSEMRRVQRGPLPALERLVDELQCRRPAPSGRAALVHGDAKPGNFAFVGDRISAVFDWELTDIGDPLADIGYLELMWALPVGITSRPSAPDFDAVVARYEERTGTAVADRAWHLALQAYKTAIILLVGSMLFEAGHTDDFRNLEMGLGVDLTTQMGLRALGVDESLEAGPVLPSDERIAAAQARNEHTDR
jgi:aminoglycoside phosphotransferase (APT) family kinase protein